MINARVSASGAMTGMLTVDELESTLDEVGIRDYTIASGAWNGNASESLRGQMREFAPEVDYVCVIHKTRMAGEQ